jgi:3-deoxy-D-manno-octulosonate 8-phosphate phosphatase (KDO 8-P phosphatase)
MSNYRQRLLHVNTFIFDYDGVLSNGNLYITSDGDALRTGNVKDGYALQLAVKKQYRVAVISGGYSESMKHRLKSLNIKDIFLGVERKIDVYNQYLSDHNLQPENILYMGDDIPDYEIMQIAGVPTCPADAVEEIKKLCAYISHKEGGQGCVRDVIEQVLKVQGKWMNDDAYHW